MTFQQAQFKYISYLRDTEGVTGEIDYPDEEQSHGTKTKSGVIVWTLYNMKGYFLGKVYSSGYIQPKYGKIVNSN
mgnify:FL=1|tara:strand:- start:56 stop:280 length:225 start_codon:yes stop_codon:yes gene_type:complete